MGAERARRWPVLVSRMGTLMLLSASPGDWAARRSVETARGLLASLEVQRRAQVSRLIASMPLSGLAGGMVFVVGWARPWWRRWGVAASSCASIWVRSCQRVSGVSWSKLTWPASASLVLVSLALSFNVWRIVLAMVWRGWFVVAARIVRYSTSCWPLL